jgi:TrkA domain protein
MSRINQTRLPGVGTRFDFVTQAGERLGLVVHRGGRCELIVCSADDPDVCRDVVRLEPDDVRTFAELLGQSPVTEEVHDVRLNMQGLHLDWVPVAAGAAADEATLHDIEHRDDEAASIVAVVRGDETIASPPSDFALHAGDTVVVVGTSAGVDALRGQLRG